MLSSQLYSGPRLAQARKPPCWGKAKKKKKGMTTKLTKLKLISCPEVVVLVVFM